MSQHRLITIAISHYCEKARWALDRAGITYVESAHVPLAHLVFTKAAGGSSTPILVTPARTITDSTDILRYADEKLANADRLFPEGEFGADVATLEASYDDVLGPAVRAWVYAYLLDGDAGALRAILTERCSLAEAVAFRALQGPIVALMKKGMRIGPTTASWALARLTPIFDDADRRLADGRKYLCGDRLTAADVTFASLASPVVDISDVRSFGATDEQLPQGFRDERKRFRSRKSGEWLAQLIRDERHRQA